VKGFVPAIIMIALLVLYLVFTVAYAIRLMMTGNGIGIAIGIALVVLPIVGAWALAAELVFVTRAQKLLARLAAAGELPIDDLPRLPSGRIDPKAADLEFPAYQSAVEAELVRGVVSPRTRVRRERRQAQGPLGDSRSHQAVARR
jgi:uncharacterized membrane protein (DUF485 family)